MVVIARLMVFAPILSISLILAACGGGADSSRDTPASTRLRALSASDEVVSSSSLTEWTGCDIVPGELFAYGGLVFPTLFPNYSGHSVYNNISYEGVTYSEARYYPSTDNWLAVSEGGMVTGLGAYTEGQLRTFGEMSSFGCAVKKLGYGNKRVLFVGIKYKNTGADPISMDVVATAAEKVKTFFVENSYGKSVLSIDVKKAWLTLPETGSYYENKYGSDERGGAFNPVVAKLVGEAYSLADVDMIVMVVPPLAYGWPGCHSGLTYDISNGVTRPVGAIMLSGYEFGCVNAALLAHELGHGYGLPLGSQLSHTSAIICGGWPRRVPAVFTDPTYSNVDCRQIQGDLSAVFKPYTMWDTMGSYRGHFNSATKVKAGWLPTTQVAVLGSGGAAGLAPFEVPSTRTQAVQIPLGNDQTGKPAAYWAEYRLQPPMDLDSGSPIDLSWNKDLVKIWLRISIPDVLGEGGYPSIEETSVFAFLDVQGNESSTELPIGGTFHDPYRGVRVRRGSNVGSDAAITVEVSKLIVTPRIGFELAPLAIGTLKVENNTGRSVTTGAVVLSGRNPNWFRIERDDCGTRSLAPGATCTITASQVSRAQGEGGIKSAELRFTTSDALLNEVAIGLIGKAQ